MSRTQHAATMTLLGCVAVASAGCRRKAPTPAAPVDAAPSVSVPAAGIEPDTPAGLEQIRRLLAYTAAQELPVTTTFRAVRTVSVPAVRSGDLPPHDAWVLWEFFHARESESRMIPLIVPSDDAEREDDTLDVHSRAELAERTHEAIGALAKREAAEFFRAREQERRTFEERLNASLARAKAGTPQSDLDRVLVQLCQSQPAQCTPHSELDVQRRGLDAAHLSTAQQPAAPSPPWYFLREAPDTPGHARSLALWLIETSPWLVPLVLEYGGWNECPSDVDHALVWRDWHRRFGASIVFLDGDTLEAWVERPPATVDERKGLAWEQYLYCEDIVSQGTGRVSALADELSGHTWFFWWD